MLCLFQTGCGHGSGRGDGGGEGGRRERRPQLLSSCRGRGRGAVRPARLSARLLRRHPARAPHGREPVFLTSCYAETFLSWSTLKLVCWSSPLDNVSQLSAYANDRACLLRVELPNVLLQSYLGCSRGGTVQAPQCKCSRMLWNIAYRRHSDLHRRSSGPAAAVQRLCTQQSSSTFSLARQPAKPVQLPAAPLRLMAPRAMTGTSTPLGLSGSRRSTSCGACR